MRKNGERELDGYMIDMYIPIVCDFPPLPEKRENFKRCFWRRLSAGGKVRWKSPQSSILRDRRRLGGVRGGERQQRQIGLWSSSGHQKGTQVINRIAGGGKEGNAS